MIGSLIFCLAASIICAFFLAFMYITKWIPWKIQLVIKNCFPNISDIKCIILYYLTMIILWLSVPTVLLFSFYYGPIVFELSATDISLILGYIFLVFFLYHNYIKIPYERGNLSQIYKYIYYAVFFGLVALQIVACNYLKNQKVIGYSSIFLGLSFITVCVFEQYILANKVIDPEEFLGKFIEYLKTNTKIEEEKISVENKIDFEMSQIPEERPKPEEKECQDNVNLTLQLFLNSSSSMKYIISIADPISDLNGILDEIPKNRISTIVIKIITIIFMIIIYSFYALFIMYFLCLIL